MCTQPGNDILLKPPYFRQTHTWLSQSTQHTPSPIWKQVRLVPVGTQSPRHEDKLRLKELTQTFLISAMKTYKSNHFHVPADLTPVQWKCGHLDPTVRLVCVDSNRNIPCLTEYTVCPQDSDKQTSAEVSALVGCVVLLGISQRFRGMTLHIFRVKQSTNSLWLRDPEYEDLCEPH